MIKQRSIWMGVAAVSLGALVALTGCSADRPAEAGHGPARRINAEQVPLTDGSGGGGRGRWAEAAETSQQSQGVFGRGRQDETALQTRPNADTARVQPGSAGAGRAGGFLAEEKGELLTLTGVLSERDDEWYLETDEGVFQLGLGRPDYRESLGITLAPGVQALVRGHLADDQEISVVTCDIEGSRFTFRTEDGVPLWSGRYRADAEAEVSRGSTGGGSGRRGGGQAEGGRGRRQG